MQSGSVPPSPSSSPQGSLLRLRHQVVVAIAVGLVVASIVLALRDPPPVHQNATEAISPVIAPETIPLVTGDEPLIELFTRPGCPVCHVIPGIPGANGRVGPPLLLGVTGKQRLLDARYHGFATTVHDYIVESVLEPQRFVVAGYPEHTMPTWYGTKLSALALEKMASYLERQITEQSVP